VVDYALALSALEFIGLLSGL